MTHASRLPWLAVLCALAVPACSFGPPGCATECEETTQLFEDPAVRVEPSVTLIEYRIVVTLTAEGAASYLAERVRTGSWLTFWVGDPDGAGGPNFGRIALRRADGSDVYALPGDSAELYPLSDCGEGECVREFRGWAEFSGVSSTGALLRVVSALVPGTDDCESPNWLRHEVERLAIADMMDASFPPPDGGGARP